MRDALHALIASQGEHRVVAEVASVDEACSLAIERQADVALVDAERMNGAAVDAVRRLRRLRPAPKVLMLAPAPDETAIAAALQAGASGYIGSESTAGMLLDAIRAVGRGDTWLPPSISRFALDAHAERLRAQRPVEELAPRAAATAVEPRPLAQGGQAGPADAQAGPLQPLTPREREVFHLLVGGESNQDIAERFRLSVKTVETHRARILRKLAVHDMAGLVRLAAKHGLL